MESARRAEAGDIDRLDELLTQAVAATPTVRGGHLFGRPGRQSVARSRLELAMSGNGSVVFSGLVDGYVVGLALISAERFGELALVGVIEELYVEPEARSVGVGEALVDAAVDWCRQQGCTGVDMAALPGDRATKNLCERSGFSARAIWMHRIL